MRGAWWLLAIAFPVAAHAGRATERFAPDQIQLAEDSLRDARAAAAAADYQRAGILARGARVDARLTWAMTDDERLRSEAASVAAQAEELSRSLGPAAQ
ncbi:MAG TPA: hypothetical protein VEU32_05715 [Burkholderiales bacterium]|nr:hypothetical protein [Burkholderiales bacterium]